MHFPSLCNWLSVRPVHITGGTNMTFFLIACLFVPRGLESSADAAQENKVINFAISKVWWLCRLAALNERWSGHLQWGMCFFFFFTMFSVNEAYCGNVWELFLVLHSYVKRHLIHSIPAFITAIKKQKSRYLCLCKLVLLLALFFSCRWTEERERERLKKNNGSVCHQLLLIAIPWQQFWKLFIFSSGPALRWLLYTL